MRPTTMRPTTARETASDGAPRLSRAALVMALVALAALYLTSSHWIIAPCAIALLAAQFGNTRLANESPLIRIGRYVLFAVIAYSAYERFTSDTSSDSMEMIFAHTVGHLCAVELAIQSWLKTPFGGPRMPAAFLLAMIILLAASNTFDFRFMPFLAPLFFLSLGAALRSHLPSHNHQKLTASTARSMALLMVIVVGALWHGGVIYFRNEISRWGMKFLEAPFMHTTSGLSTTPRLGARFEYRGTLTRMLRVEGMPADTYLRAMAFSEYQHGRWLPAVESRNYAPQAAQFFRPNAQGQHARIERLVEDNGTVFSPLHAAGLLLEGDTAWHRDLGPVSTVNSSETPLKLDYTVILAPDPEHQGPLCAAPDTRWQDEFLAVPAHVKPKVRELALKIGNAAKTPREKVRAVENYLISHHKYSYSARPGEGDPVSDFLMQKRSAHCEFFASSAVILLRYLGVPSRYVIGYMAHEPAGDNVLIVRGRDAHAWAESWIGDKWITVEATPGGGQPDGRAEPLPWTLKWRETVMGWVNAARRGIEWLRELPITVWLAAVGLLFAWLVFNAWRQRAYTAPDDIFHYSTRDEGLANLALRFDKWLEQRGLPCPPGQNWTQHLDAVHLESALSFARAYETARFSPQSGDMQELRRMLHELETSTKD